MPSESPRIVVVRDQHDTPTTRDLLNRIHNLDRGVLVVRPVPGTSGPAVLALAVLAALGKQVEPRPREQQRLWWPLARAWTVGHQVDYLVIDRAHTLPAALVRDLIGLGQAAGAVGVWFVDASPKRIAPALASLSGVVTERPQQLLNLTIVERDRLPSHFDPALHIPQVVPPITLPHTGFLHFRHACDRHLSGPAAAMVGVAWERTFEVMRRWLRMTDLYEYGPPDDQRLISELPRLVPKLSVQLAALLYTAGHPADALVRLRATQAALFRSGLLLHHEPRLASAPAQALGCPLTADVAATINRPVSTTAATAAVLHLVYPFGGRQRIERVPTWRLSHIEPDGSQLLTEHGPIPVPTCGHAILRAHLHWANPTGSAAPQTALFDDRRHDLDDLAQQALRPLNLHNPIGAGYRRSRAYLRGHATTWMLQRGLELAALAEIAPRPGPR